MSNTVRTKRRLRRACLAGVAATGGAALLVTALSAFAETADPTYQAACEVEMEPPKAAPVT